MSQASNNVAASDESAELAALRREADVALRSRNYPTAIEALLKLSERSEIPPGDLCAKLARAYSESGQPENACAWAARVAESTDGFMAWSAAAKILLKHGPAQAPRIRRALRLAVVGTWTTNAFVPLLQLAAARLGLALEVYEAAFDQYFPETLNPTSALHAWQPEALLLCPDYRALGLPAFSDQPEATIEEAVQRWSGVWKAVRSTTPASIAQQLFALPASDAFGHFGAGLPGTRASMAYEINRRLAQQAIEQDVGIVNAEALAAYFGKRHWFDERNWHLAKVAVAPAALPLLAQRSASVLAARAGLSRKCLVLDLDNTLWGGVIGDDGVNGIVLGEGAEGEAFVDFQRAVKALKERGIVLAVCSKNDVERAKEPFLSHPEMVLRLEDIACFVANWQSKSENLRHIARSLNLGLDSLVFVDDNPYERAQARSAVPEVDVLMLPEDPVAYRCALEDYPSFEPASFTNEDRARAEQYQARIQAENLRSDSGSLEDYQASLGMEATIGPIDAVNLSRVAQLINKTNQFNVTTRRRERAEVEALLEDPKVAHFWVRLKDRFADHGLIAVVIAIANGKRLEVDTLLMSCRVIGRGVEEIMRDELARLAQGMGCSEVVGRYIPTERNSLVEDLWPRLGFLPLTTQNEDSSSAWSYELSKAAPSSAPITIIRN